MSETETRDPAVEPTPAQWVDDFLATNRKGQEAIAGFIRDAAHRSARCIRESHEYRLDDLEHAAIDRSGDVAVAEERLSEAQAELFRLRGVVEAVQALADKWRQRAHDSQSRANLSGVHPNTATLLRVDAGALLDAADDLRAALAPVSSSGEAESGEGCATCGGSGFVPEADDPDYPEAGVHQTHCPDCPTLAPSGEAESGEAVGGGVEPSIVVDWSAGYPDVVRVGVGDGCESRDPAPAPSGGQADGEGEVERVISVPADLLVDVARRLYTAGDDAVRGQVEALLEGRDWQHHARAEVAARPVLSREALADLLLAHQGEWDDEGRYITCDCGWKGPAGAGAHAHHVADVLAGGEQA